MFAGIKLVYFPSSNNVFISMSFLKGTFAVYRTVRELEQSQGAAVGPSQGVGSPCVGSGKGAGGPPGRGPRGWGWRDVGPHWERRCGGVWAGMCCHWQGHQPEPEASRGQGDSGGISAAHSCKACQGRGRL